MSDLARSISAVHVVEDHMPTVEALSRLVDALEACSVDSELIIVANGVNDVQARDLKQATTALRDATCYFLDARLDHDRAILIGMDNAVGDLVLLADDLENAVAALPSLLESVGEGFDVAIVRQSGLSDADPAAYRLTRDLFFGFLRLMTRLPIDPVASRLRLLSRPASQFILGSANADMMLRCASPAPGFPSAMIEAQGLKAPPQPARTFTGGLDKGLQAIASSSTAPLRLLSITGVIGSALSLLYSVYVLVVRFFVDSIAPGWTTLSLQVSGMMFFNSIMFVIMAEYLIQLRGDPSRRLTRSAREIRSPKSRRIGRRNLVNETGGFTLGWGEGLETLRQDNRLPARRQRGASGES